MKSKFVIARCSAAGVHAGILVSRKGNEVVLKQSRRLWYWVVPDGKPAFLSGISQYGLGKDCKIGCPISVTLTEVCEVIECSDIAKKSITEYPSHERS